MRKRLASMLQLAFGRDSVLSISSILLPPHAFTDYLRFKTGLRCTAPTDMSGRQLKNASARRKCTAYKMSDRAAAQRSSSAARPRYADDS
jgi:hypothetical protein